jgi:hypothetical protein
LAVLRVRVYVPTELVAGFIAFFAFFDEFRVGEKLFECGFVGYGVVGEFYYCYCRLFFTFIFFIFFFKLLNRIVSELAQPCEYHWQRTHLLHFFIVISIG